MARTNSTMLELGTRAPHFSLPEPASGKAVSLDDFAGQPLLVVFSCNHCPYVLHIIDAFTAFANEYRDKGLSTVMINANDVANYEADSPHKMIELAKTKGFTFPYLYDESQSVAKAYRAACTPDLFLFNAQHELVYRGQFDGARPGNEVAVSGVDLRMATDQLLSGASIPAQQVPSMGCNIKWKAGNEPDYF
jgi:peroxiredoxin